MRFLLLTALVFGSAARAAEALRNPDGSLKLMNQTEALTACPAGLHLPTARELALEGVARGAMKLLERNEEIPADADGISVYGKIVARELDGSIDAFYQTPSGYEAPVGDLGAKNIFFWSSSFMSPGIEQVYALSAENGWLMPLPRDFSVMPLLKYQMAVLCVQDQ